MWSRPNRINVCKKNSFSIIGLLNGHVQLLLTAVPLGGRINVSARQLSISAAFDLQKNPQRVPFLRMQSCELRSGFVSTQVNDLGLLTDSINLKYKVHL